MAVTQERVRRPLAVRRVIVLEVDRSVPGMACVTFGGPELEGFASEGPADHMKVFFPDPTTGTLVAPPTTAGGEATGEGGTPLARDFTPRWFGPGADGAPRLRIDFALHPDAGPASAWAAGAEPGDELVVAGPRGSKLVPEGMSRLLLLADESALPAAARWLERVPDGVPVEALFLVHDEAVAAYLPPELEARAEVEWLPASARPEEIESTVRQMAEGADERAFAFLAGEASTLIPLRRLLRELLPDGRDQVSASGYWRRGVAGLDHHAPLDPDAGE
jgi:NADPH-dependent ferric siderophore reductase